MFGPQPDGCDCYDALCTLPDGDTDPIPIIIVVVLGIACVVVVPFVIFLLWRMCKKLKAKMAGRRVRMDPQAPGGEVTLCDTLMTSRTFRGLTDSPSSAHIGASVVGQPVVGTAVAPTGGAWGARFDPNTGQPIPKFDPMTGKQNWDDGLGDTRL